MYNEKKMNRLSIQPYQWGFGIYLFFSIALPSNYIFNIPVKFFALGLAAGCFLITTAQYNINKKSAIYFVLSLTLWAFWTLLGFTNGYKPSSVVAESSGFLISITTLYLSFSLTNSNNKISLASSIIKFAFFGSLAFLTIKLFIFIATIYNPGFYVVASEILNYQPVGLSIVTGGSRLSYVSSDFATLSIITITYIFRKEIGITNTITWYLTFVLLLVSLYSAYSRSLFLVAILYSLLYLFYYNRTTTSRKAVAILVTGVLIWWLASNFYVEISMLLEQRFYNQENSDSHRTTMVEELTSYWAKSFLIGWGLGSYVPNYIRSESIPYSYEVQLLSLFMKTGIAGAVVLIVLSSNFIYKCITKRKPYSILPIIYIVLMLNSMTNQYLLSTATAVLLVVLWHAKELPKAHKRKALC